MRLPEFPLSARSAVTDTGGCAASAYGSDCGWRRGCVFRIGVRAAPEKARVQSSACTEASQRERCGRSERGSACTRGASRRWRGMRLSLPARMRQPEWGMVDAGRQLRVALWGFHAYGHFGDDLVAGLVALHLQRTHGADIRAYRLCAPYARRFGIEVVDSIDALVDGSDCVVFAGGSTLESSPPPSRRFGLAAALPQHGLDSARILELTKLDGIPIIGTSIGGDGKYPRHLEPPSKQEFLTRARSISVRYADDLRLLREAGTAGDYFPDLLWSTALQFPRVPVTKPHLRIGIAVYGGQLLAQKALLAPLMLYACALRRRDVEFVFLDSANADKSPFRALPRLPGVRGETYQFREPDEDLRVLASLDALVSTQLPLGIVAASYDIPFLALLPETKTRRMMTESGLEHLCFGHERLGQLREILLQPGGLGHLLDNVSLRSYREDSNGHLRRLSDEISLLQAAPEPR